MKKMKLVSAVLLLGALGGCADTPSEEVRAYSGQNDWPRTCADAVALLATEFEADPDAKAELASKTRDDLIIYHHGTGMWIRNNFGLWGGNDELMIDCHEKYGDLSAGYIHQDDISHIIIEQYWLTLQPS